MSLELLRCPLRHFRVAVGQPKGPSTGKRWLILNGYIYHVTKTDTTYEIRAKDTAETLSFLMIPLANATGSYPLWRTFSGDQVQSYPVWEILDDTMEIVISGDTPAYLKVRVLEF